MTLELEVNGGTSQVTARYDDMLTEAAQVDAFADGVRATAWDLQGTLVDPDLLASAVLNPAGAARATAELWEAVNGPRGLTALAMSLELRAVGLRTSVRAYELADQRMDDLVTVLQWCGGAGLGVTAPLWVPMVVGGALGAGGLVALDRAVNDGEITAAVEEWLVDNAHLTDHLVGAVPGLLTGGFARLPIRPPPVLTIADSIGLFAWMYRNGTGRIERVMPPTRSARPMHGAEVESLLTGLAALNAPPPTGEVKPAVQVRRVTSRGADGVETTRWIVYIPGTSKWDLPGSDANPGNTGGNVHSFIGNETAYQQAVREALRAAMGGAAPDGQQVMLVGHSLGGMVAMQAASDLVGRGYDVTHVLTAGSPVAHHPPPRGVHVLSLENTGDAVPYLDGSPNPSGPSWTSVRFDNDAATFGGAHSIDDGYLEGARAIDDSTQPDVAAWRDSAAGYFDPGATVSDPWEYAVIRD